MSGLKGTDLQEATSAATSAAAALPSNSTQQEDRSNYEDLGKDVVDDVATIDLGKTWI